MFYREASFDIGDFSISYEKSDWFEYFKCGIRGIRDKYADRKLKGMKVLIDGTIPRSAGLSSSSALVVCAALATTINNGITISKVHGFVLFFFEFHQLFCRVILPNFVLNVKNTLAHKEVSNSMKISLEQCSTGIIGGMDQAASCLAHSGSVCSFCHAIVSVH